MKRLVIGILAHVDKVNKDNQTAHGLSALSGAAQRRVKLVTTQGGIS